MEVFFKKQKEKKKKKRGLILTDSLYSGHRI